MCFATPSHCLLAKSVPRREHTGPAPDRENDGTGLYFMRARYYAPNVGRFTQEDPAREGGGLNLHLYAGANPISFIDPSGRAYFAKRPLRGRAGWLAWTAPCGTLDDEKNTQPFHEELFFEDGKSPTHLGFHEDSTVRQDDSKGPWFCKSGHYDDRCMRKAVANVGVPKPYCVAGPNQFNCQDWADLVRREYARLIAAAK
jgi:RHS repeat-associated protein